MVVRRLSSTRLVRFDSGVLQIAILLTGLARCAEAGPDSNVPVVQTDIGVVAGTRVVVGDRKVDAFLGIPYAEPPVGDLRFLNPRPKAPWNGTYNATSKPKPCWQLPLHLAGLVVLRYRSSASEDCLYLNVWKPATACSKLMGCGEKRPVVVYIHGGAFQWGDSSLYFYDASNFVAMTDVVFVTFNYRVSVLGFLSLENPKLPGNMGLWDQNLVLKWVQRNIANFGGDPDQITLSGQSAGGISAGMHALSPHSRGLFKRIIAQSGTPLSMLLGRAYTGPGKFSRFAGIFGCYNASLDVSEQLSDVMGCLRKLDAAVIFEKLEKEHPRNHHFSPVYGDEFLPNNVLSMDTWKDWTPKEILLGSVLNEGPLFFEQMERTYPHFAKKLDTEYRVAVTVGLSEMLGIPMADIGRIANAYLGENGTYHDTYSARHIISEMFGDAIFSCPTQLFADLVADRGISPFRYVFAHRSSFSIWPRWMGVVHSDELVYTLGSLPFINDPSKLTEAMGPMAPVFYSGMAYTDEEEEFMRQLVATWSSFVQTGKPMIPGSSTEWPKYSVKNPELLYLRPGNLTKQQDQKREICELWRPLILGTSSTSTPAAAGPAPPRKPKKPHYSSQEERTVMSVSASTTPPPSKKPTKTQKVPVWKRKPEGFYETGSSASTARTTHYVPLVTVVFAITFSR